MLCGLLLIGCDETKPISHEKTASGYTIQFIFEKDGCKVYRFRTGDSGTWIYYTDCRGNVQHTYKRGKQPKRTDYTVNTGSDE